jgi:hypothetical protein
VLTRREALRAGAVVAAAAASTVLAVPAGATVVRPRRVRLHPLRRSRFAPLVRSTFQLTGLGESRSVRLAAVRGGTEGEASEHSFTLRFEDAAARPLREGIYTVSHPRLGAVPLFLAPVGSTAGRYEAVVNRLA